MDVEWQVEMDDSDDEEVRKAKCVRKPSGGTFRGATLQENFQELVCLWGNCFQSWDFFRGVWQENFYFGTFLAEMLVMICIMKAAEVTPR